MAAEQARNSRPKATKIDSSRMSLEELKEAEEVKEALAAKEKEMIAQEEAMDARRREQTVSVSDFLKEFTRWKAEKAEEEAAGGSEEGGHEQRAGWDLSDEPEMPREGHAALERNLRGEEGVGHAVRRMDPDEGAEAVVRRLDLTRCKSFYLRRITLSF